jgi:hypothetical protein
MPIWFEVPMPETSFEVQLKALKVRIVPMERLVTAIAGSVPKPLFYDSGQEHFGFRYAKPGVLHFCLLKAVRTVSALNAMVALARGGYAQEIGVLVRTLVECTTHIEFVLDALNDEGELRPEVDKYIRDYFADYARNSSADFKRAQVKQGLVHKHLGETLDIIAEQNALVEGRKPAETAYSNIYLTYSNYVHAKYPEVMDLHGGDPGRFHLDGMRGTPKDDENFAIIDTFIDTAAIALKLIVSKLRLHHLLESDVPLRIWFRSS